MSGGNCIFFSRHPFAVLRNVTKILSSGEPLQPSFEAGTARIKEQSGLLRTGNGTSSPVFNIQEVRASILDLSPTILPEGFSHCVHSKILL